MPASIAHCFAGIAHCSRKDCTLPLQVLRNVQRRLHNAACAKKQFQRKQPLQTNMAPSISREPYLL
jgi:hypothetical protein